MFRNVEIRRLHRQNYVEKLMILMKMNEFAYLRAQRDWKGAEIALTMTTDGQQYTRSRKNKQK